MGWLWVCVCVCACVRVCKCARVRACVCVRVNNQIFKGPMLVPICLFEPCLLGWWALIRKKARGTGLGSDWLLFRQLRNASTVAIRKAKADHFLTETSNNLNNPLKFWKTIKSITGNKNGIDLPPCIVKDSTQIYEKADMLGCFNEHFIAAGSLFNSENIAQGSSACSVCSFYFWRCYTFRGP